MALILVAAIIIGLIPAIIASNKGHSFFVWWFFGAAFFILALPLALLLKPNYPVPIAAPQQCLKRCPFCAEFIQEQAIVCRFCGRDLPDSWHAQVERPPAAAVAASSGQQNAERPASAPRPRSRVGLVFIAIVAVVMVIYAVMSLSDDARKRTPDSPASLMGDPTQQAIYAYKTANIRSGPSTSDAIVRTAQPGEQLVVTGRWADWYRVSSPDTSVEYWIHDSVVLTERQKEHRANASLRLDSWQWSHSYGFATAEGQVTNVSSERLQNVVALVSFSDDSGEFITSDSALLEYNPILPGQTSPWKVMAPWNPRMSKARVEFKYLMGGEIDWYQE